MATGKRLLSQVMPSTYRQGYTYPTKTDYEWLEAIGSNPSTHRAHWRKLKRTGSRILRKALKDSMNKEIEQL